MNLIFTAFATLEGYREGSNANLGSEVFYRCIVVSLVSAKQKNQNCNAALVTNTAVPEPYAAQLSQAGIRVIACPFDNYRFEADLDWSLAYYKLCAMQYLLETEHYENLPDAGFRYLYPARLSGYLARSRGSGAAVSGAPIRPASP